MGAGKAPLLLFLVVFSVGFLFASFLLQNLPFTFGDDLNVIDVAKKTSWGFLWRELLNPWTPAWYVHGAECLLSTRVLETLLFKFLYETFAYNTNAFFALKSLGYAGTGTFIFLTLFASTGQRGWSAAAALFFFLLPPVYRSLSWMADLEIVAQMFLLINFFLFLRVYFAEQKSLVSSIVSILLLIGTGWLGIKLKETARIMPFVLIAFLLLHQNIRIFPWMKSVKNVLLLAASVLLLGAVVPWRKSSTLSLDARSDVAIFQLDFTPWISFLPTLVGFVAIIFLFACVAWVLTLNPPFIPPFTKGGRPPALRAVRLGEGDLASGNRGNLAVTSATEWQGLGIFLFLLLWSGACLAGFALNFRIQGNIRYLTTPLIPLTVLGFFLFAKAACLNVGKRRRVLQFLFAICLAIQMQRNLDEVIFARNFHSGLDIADYLMTKEIYEDRFADEEASWEDLDNFYRAKDPARPDEFRKIRIKEWDENKKEETRVEHLANVAFHWGVAYVLSFKEGLYSEEPRVREIFRGTTANGSLYSAVIAKLKKKSHRRIVLYKYV